MKTCGSIQELRHQCVSSVWQTGWEEKPRGPGVERSGQPLDICSQRSATRRFASAQETVSTWRMTFRLRPRELACRGQNQTVGQVCDRGSIITFRSTGGTILNAFTCNRLEFECAGGVCRLRAETSSTTQCGTGRVKVLSNILGCR